jgi:hypothetical protein
MSCTGGEFSSGPAPIPSTHAEAIGQSGPALVTPAGRLHRSANTPRAGEIFQEISGGGDAFGGFAYPGGNLAGRVTYCGASMRLRSATSDFWIVVEKRFLEPTFSCLS